MRMALVTPYLSVVVISWNQLPALRRLIPQLLDQNYAQESYELIVVDDGSTDGTHEWLASLNSDRFRVVTGTTNAGRSASRNRGIREAHGKVIVMIDGDHTVQTDFLAVHASRHRGEACVIVGKSVFDDHPDFRAMNYYLNHCGAIKLPTDRPIPGRYFVTGNCSVPRELLLQVGLFDERFSAWGGEDLDLGVRLVATGVPIYGEPRALAVHHHLRPLDDLLHNLFIYGRESIPLLIAKHPHLFKELNLDRSLRSPDNTSRFSASYRFLFRCLFLAPIYHSVRLVVKWLRRRRLPRFLFDYLHLRQYTLGYRAFLRNKKGS